jgi:PAS domain S-box-containing protein
MDEKLKISRLFSYLRAWQIPILIIVVMGFGFSHFISSLHILQEEERLIREFETGTRSLLEAEEDFHDVETAILSLHPSNRYEGFGKEYEIPEVKGGFYLFKQKFDRFAQGYVAQESVSLSFQREINQIYQHVENIESLFEEGALKIPRERKYYELLGELDELGKQIEEVGESTREEAEESYVQVDLRQRHTELFMSVSFLVTSCLMALIFSGIKNMQLEKSNKEHKKISEISARNMQALEEATDGVAILDAEGNLVYMNRACWELHGVSDEAREKYLNNPWVDLYNKKGQKFVYDYVYPELYAKGKWRGETKIARVDGKIVDVEMALTLLPGNQGMIGTGHDISDRRRAENEKNKLQEQIYQAQKMEAIGRLTGGIAHDFNNILAAINGYAEFLSEDLEDKDPKLKGFADSILTAGEKARGLIDQMLAFSRRKENALTLIDLKSVVDETAFMLSASTPKTIEIQVEYQSTRPAYVEGDPYQLTQALMNLCVNACDAMESERGELTIHLMEIEPDEDTYGEMFEAELTDEFEVPRARITEIDDTHTYMELGAMVRGENYYQLSVSDTGTGMTRTVVEHMFEPFFTTKAVDKGTGLGMANVYGTMVTHKAAVSVNTILNEGTTFDLYFQKKSSFLHADAGIIPEKTPKQNLSDIRILLIDDEEQVLAMMSHMLERENIEHKSFSRPTAALAYLAEQDECPFDLVISDQNMPKMTGLELVEKVSKIFPELPFVIISGYSQERLYEIQNAYPTIKKCLRKPVKKAEVLDMIAEIFHVSEEKV